MSQYIRTSIDHRAVSRSKYRNQRIETPDGKFDSKGEYARFCELRLLERAGHIKDLRRQVRYELIPSFNGERAVYYVADFVYQRDGKDVVEDHKGYNKNRLYMLKKKILAWRHGIEVIES